MEGVIFILILLGAPLLFYLLLRSQIETNSERIRQELHRMSKRLDAIEGKSSQQGTDREEAGSKPERETTDKEESRPAEKGDEAVETTGESESSVPPEIKASSEERTTEEHPEEEQPKAEKEAASQVGEEESPTSASETESEQGKKRAPLSSDIAAEQKAKGPRNRPPSGIGTSEGPTGGARGTSSEWERFVGENLINKVGIAILVLGIAFFVKYAIDQGWLGEGGRVIVGILSGTGLIGVAHLLRQRFKAFSSVLVGGGLAVHYFTITIAFQEYQLFSQTAAFVIMLAITAFAVLLSLFYDKQELAVIALLGGFGTPFMVSTGEGSYIVLFSYLIILNLGMLFLAHTRHWTVVNFVSYIATVIIFGSWLLGTIDEKPQGPPFPGSLLFASAFFVIFYLMALAYKVRKGLSFEAADHSVLLSCNALYFAAGLGILHEVGAERFQGLFTIGMAAFNFLFAFRYYLKKAVDRNLFYHLIGLTLTLITLAGPIQLKGDHITLFWSAEAVLLLWLAQRSGIELMKLGSVVVSALMLVSLFMDWGDVYASFLFASPSGEKLRLLANPGFLTGMVSVASLACTRYLLHREESSFFYPSIPLNDYRGLISGSLIVLTYTVPLLELYAQARSRIGHEAVQAVLTGSYHYFAAFVLLGLARWRGNLTLRSIAFFAGILLCLFYMLYYQPRAAEVRDAYLLGHQVSLLGQLLHYLLVVGVLLVLHRCWGLIKAMEEESEDPRKFFRWFATLVVVFVGSTELDQLVLWIGSGSDMSINALLEQNAMIGYPVLWGLCSFYLMRKGLKQKIRNLRLIALTLFTITLLKLFILDIQEIPEVGRVIAFISLGCLLLVISFMYQKLKGIVLDDDQGKQE